KSRVMTAIEAMSRQEGLSHFSGCFRKQGPPGYMTDRGEDSTGKVNTFPPINLARLCIHALYRREKRIMLNSRYAITTQKYFRQHLQAQVTYPIDPKSITVKAIETHDLKSNK